MSDRQTVTGETRGPRSTLLLCLLLAGQFTVFCSQPWRAETVADEGEYLDTASALLEQHRFPQATPRQQAVLGGTAWGTSRFHPPGYPVVLALLGVSRSDPVLARIRAGVVHFVAMSFCLVLIHLRLRRASQTDGGWTLGAAVALGLQPWTFAYARSLLPDSLNASLLTLGLLGLGSFLQAMEPGRRLRAFTLGSAGLAATLLFRPEMIAVGPVLAGAAVLLGARETRARLKYLALAASLWAGIVGVQVGYRLHFVGRLEIFGPFITDNQGAYDWVHTWFGSEHETYDFAYAVHASGARVADLPERAFGDAWERRMVEHAVERAAQRPYDEATDRILRDVAEKRIRDNWFRNYFLTRLWRTCHLWLNLETSETLLRALAEWTRSARRVVLLSLLVLKGLLFLLCAAAAGGVLRRWRRASLRAIDRVTLLMLTGVVWRTLLIGIVLGYGVHRYVLTVWPALLWCACAALPPSRLRE